MLAPMTCQRRYQTYEIMNYLGESGTLGNFLHPFYQGTEIYGRNGRVTDKFNEVIDDHDGTSLDFHAAIVESTEQKRNQNRQSRGLYLCNESGTR
jgi:hypothetical protein